MELAPPVDVPAAPAGPAVAAEVERPGVQAGGRQLLPDVLVPAGVVAQPVDEQHVRPRAAGPGAAGRRLVGQPVADQQLGAVGGRRAADDRWHAGSVRASRHRYDASVPAWTEIGDRVFVRRYAFYDQNIGVVLGDGAALVIDTRSTHVQAREILADLRELTADPVTVVVNTHGHFDHAFGNHVFRPATIWGHVGCPPFMVRTGRASAGRGSPPTSRPSPPT